MHKTTPTSTTSKSGDLKALIVGASGNLGSHITKFLCENHMNEVNLSLLVPEESRQKVANFEKTLGGKILTFDVLNGSCEDLCQMLKDFTIVINCMNFFDPNDEFKAESNLINCCVKSGVNYYIPSDFSIDFRNVKSTENLPRIEVRKKIHTLLNQNTQLKWVSILCGIIVEKLLFEDCHLINKTDYSMNIYGSGNEEFEVSTYDDVARFVSELIVRRNFEKFTNQFVTIYSEKLTFKELGNWLREIWGHDLKMKNLGSIKELDKKLTEVKNTDMTQFYYLQYMKVILQNEARIKDQEKTVWPNIKKSGVKSVVRQWTTQTSTGIAL